MDETFQLDVRLTADFPDLFKRQFSGQDHAREADLLPEFDPLGRGIVHLGTGDQRQWRQVQLQQSDILNDQAVSACFIELVNHPLGRGKLIVAQERVEGHIDFCIVLMCEVCDLLDSGQAVAGGLAGAESLRPDIDGVGAAQNRRAGGRAVLRRSQ